MIVIINGPLGIGKTETSWKLLEMFEQGVMLDGDFVGAVHPFEIYDQERIDYLYQTLHHLVAFHIQNGYRNFVVNYVFESPETLAQFESDPFRVAPVFVHHHRCQSIGQGRLRDR